MHRSVPALAPKAMVNKKLRHRRAALTLAISDDAGNGTTLRRTLKLR